MSVIFCYKQQPQPWMYYITPEKITFSGDCCPALVTDLTHLLPFQVISQGAFQKLEYRLYGDTAWTELAITYSEVMIEGFYFISYNGSAVTELPCGVYEFRLTAGEMWWFEPFTVVDFDIIENAYTLRDDLMIPFKFSEQQYETIPLIAPCDSFLPFTFATENTTSGTIQIFLYDVIADCLVTELTDMVVTVMTISGKTYYIHEGECRETFLDCGIYKLEIVDGEHSYFSVPFDVECDISDIPDGYRPMLDFNRCVMRDEYGNILYEVCEGIDPLCLGSEMGEGYPGTFEDALAFYRNLEMDNTLPVSDYVGRTKAIQTAIQFVEEDATSITLCNMPYIQELVDTPENFGLYNMDVQPFVGMIYGITSVSYIGTYLGYTNCCKITMPSVCSGTLNDHYGIYNIFPNGMWRNTNKIVPLNTGEWNQTYTVGGGSVWKDSDGNYCMLVDGYYKTRSVKMKQHLFKASALDGVWVDQNAATDNLFDSSVLPAGYLGCWIILGNVECPHNTYGKIYAGATSLCDASYQYLAPAIAMWNEDMTYREAFNIDTDYVFENSYSYWSSGLTYYKGKFYIGVQDGAYNSGKRVILCADCLNSTYSYHSTLFDFTNPVPDYDDGSMINGSFANGSLLTMNDKLYFMSSGQSVDNNPYVGEYNNHCAYLWLYDDATNTWSPVIGSFPFLTSPHSNVLFGYNWGYDHTGYMAGFYFEDGKLWWTNALNQATDTYELTNGYIELK